VAGVPAGAGDDPTPCEGWTVTQVLQHAAGDQQGFAAVLTGGPFPEENPFAPSGILSGSMAGLLEPALDAARQAWSTVDPAETAVPTPLPQGALPAGVAVGACALDAAVHAWDIAVATGQPSPLTPAAARALLDVARAVVEPLRPFGAYAPALAGEAGDDGVAALLRYLGRRPDWTA
jgi:uncharacterized protein (TIGR03086 family)